MSSITSSKIELPTSLRLSCKSRALEHTLTRVYLQLQTAVREASDCDARLIKLVQRCPAKVADVSSYEDQISVALKERTELSKRLAPIFFDWAEKTNEAHREKYCKKNLKKCHKSQLKELHEVALHFLREGRYAREDAQIRKESETRKNYAQKALEFKDFQKQAEALCGEISRPDTPDRKKAELKERLEAHLKESRARVGLLAELEVQVPEGLRCGFVDLVRTPGAGDRAIATLELAFEQQALCHVSALKWGEAKALLASLPEERRVGVYKAISYSQYRVQSCAWEVADLVLPLLRKAVGSTALGGKTPRAVTVAVDLVQRCSKETFVRDWLISRHIDRPQLVTELTHFSHRALVKSWVGLVGDFVSPPIVRRMPTAWRGRALAALDCWKVGEYLFSLKDRLAKPNSLVFSGVDLVSSLASGSDFEMVRSPSLSAVIGTAKKIQEDSLFSVFKGMDLAARYSEALRAVGRNVVQELRVIKWVQKTPAVSSSLVCRLGLVGVGILSAFHFRRDYPYIWAVHVMQQARLLCQQAKWREANEFLEAEIKSPLSYFGDRQAVQGYQQFCVKLWLLTSGLRANQRSEKLLDTVFVGIGSLINSFRIVSHYTALADWVSGMRMVALLQVGKYDRFGILIAGEPQKVQEYVVAAVIGSAIHDSPDPALAYLVRISDRFLPKQQAILDAYRAYQRVQDAERGQRIPALDRLIGSMKILERDDSLVVPFQKVRFLIDYDEGNNEEARNYLSSLTVSVRKKMGIFCIERALESFKSGQVPKALMMLESIGRLFPDVCDQSLIEKYHLYFERCVQKFDSRGISLPPDPHTFGLRMWAIDDLLQSMKGKASFEELSLNLKLEKVHAFLGLGKDRRVEDFQRVKFLKSEEEAFHRRVALGVIRNAHLLLNTGSHEAARKFLLEVHFLDGFLFANAILKYRRHLGILSNPPIGIDRHLEFDSWIGLMEDLIERFQNRDFEEVRLELELDKLCAYVDARRGGSVRAYLSTLQPRQHLLFVERLVQKMNKMEAPTRVKYHQYLESSLIIEKEGNSHQQMHILNYWDILVAYQRLKNMKELLLVPSTGLRVDPESIGAACLALINSLEGESILEEEYSAARELRERILQVQTQVPHFA